MGWLGLTDFKTEGRWVLMSSGQEASYMNWDQPSEPSDNSGEENCAHISMAKWQWNDRPCEDTSQNNRYTYHALCEMETTTETPASDACGTYSYEGRTMLIVAGGMDKMSVEMSTAEVYSEGDASWGLADNLFSPAAFLRGATIDNTFYLVGGWFDGGRRGEERSAEGRGVEGADDWIYEFEPERQKWVERERMPYARYGHGVVAVPQKYFDDFCKP